LFPVGTVGGGRMWGEGVGGWILFQYCVYKYENGKMRPVETISGMEYKGE
jgi:hypothetical protein